MKFTTSIALALLGATMAQPNEENLELQEALNVQIKIAQKTDVKIQGLITDALKNGGKPYEITAPTVTNADKEGQEKLGMPSKAPNYKFDWKFVCAFTKWTPSNQFMHAGMKYDAAKMTLQRFGFVGTQKQCFWGMTGVHWLKPLKVDQIIPKGGVKATPATDGGLATSSIFANDKEKNNLVQMMNLPAASSKLLFKASRDGWTGVDFLAKVKGVKGTLTIVKQSDGKIIGGYTNLPWYSVSAKKYIQGTFKSFLFTMNTDGTFNRWDKTKADQYGEIAVAPKRLAYFPNFFRLGDNCNVAKSASTSTTKRTNEYWSLATKTPVPAANKYKFQCAEIETYSI